VTPPSGGQAASAQGELFFAVRRWQETSGDAGLLLQDVFIRLTGENYLAPDLALVGGRTAAGARSGRARRRPRPCR
jgi:Putative restriction endonuclease